MTEHETPQPDWPLIERVLTGDATPDDRAAFDRWAAQGIPEPIRFDAPAALDQAHERLGISSPSSVTSHISGPAQHRASWWHAIWLAPVAALMAIIAIGISRPWSNHASSKNGIEQFSTPGGGRTSVILRDGTHVVLGPDTRLRVMADFGRASRTVQLEGEGYFTVIHDAQHPFAVQTAHTEIHDVGTQFAVHAYTGDSHEWVAVAEGEIQIGQTHLVPRMVGMVDNTGTLTTKHDADLSPYLGWIQGRLVFDGAPLRDVVRELSRTFDTSITIADSTLATYQVSGSFDHETLKAILDDITDAMGGRYERDSHGAFVILRGRVNSRPYLPHVVAVVGAGQGRRRSLRNDPPVSPPNDTSAMQPHTNSPTP